MKPPTVAVACRSLMTALILSLAPVWNVAGAVALTKDDYARADGLRDRTRDKVVHDRVQAHWLDGSQRFWYRNDLPDGSRQFIIVDPAKRTRQPAFDHVKLADALTRTTGKAHRSTHLPITRIAFSKEGALTLEADGKTWRFDSAAGTITATDSLPETPQTQTPSPRRGTGSRFVGSPRRQDSPDSKWTTVLRNHNLILRDKQSDEEFALTTEGTEKDGYEANVFWSPDSKKLIALRTAKGDDRKVYLVESSPSGQLQPKLQSYNYLKPGDRVPVTKPHLFDVATHKELSVRDSLFAEPYEIGEYRWHPDSSRFTFLFNQRGHQVLRIVGIDSTTGNAQAVIDEQSKTFIDYAGKFFRHDLEQTGEIVWMSERDGWNHLYLYDSHTGNVKNQITKGEWVVRGVDHVDHDARQIWFRAGGIRPAQDPYYIHYARVNFDGTGLTVLTEGDGTHQAEFSPDRKYLIDTYSRVDAPPVVELRSATDGSLICELERADWSALLSTGWQVPERFVAKGRDGKTDIYGVIWRPTQFDPKKKYPIIEQIYAGPQGSFVPKAFAAYHRAQSLAELGFVVVQMDGMGTSNRSKAFHDVACKNLGDAGFPDRILWMTAAAQKYPYMDLTRVGVYGGSAGGQNALRALLAFGNFYKVAVADCGCHDNRMDKIWWNELWMGWPIGPHYADQSNVTQAHKLQGKLLLMVGELDRNVDPASTMQVVNALIKAGKDFEYVIFPGAGHGAGSSRYGERRRRDFFVKHLLKAEPPDWNAEEPKEAIAESQPAAKPPATQTRDQAVTRTASERTTRRLAAAAHDDMSDVDTMTSEMRPIIERFVADHASIAGGRAGGRRFTTAELEPSPQQTRRTRTFYNQWLQNLRQVDFETMGQPGRIDYILLRNQIDYELQRIDERTRLDKEASPILPFASRLWNLEEARLRMESVDAQKVAALLNEVNKEIQETRKTIERQLKGDSKSSKAELSKAAAVRAVEMTEGLRTALRSWSTFYNGYDPLFTWWATEPYKTIDKSLQDYATFLRDRVAGIRRADGDDRVVEPIGASALQNELVHAMIPYSADELVTLANQEFAWCEAEMKRASREMGYGDDWKKALEKVKTLHVEPGKQPALIHDLALEAIQFLDEHDLITVPPLARESWKMEMMPPQRQLVNPFFTGGDVISVSYPTNTMTHEQKLMSMRGNNIPFSRATVHHELIPGHHLQGYMSARYKPYRRPFSTPFWTEGWALYWETLLWDLKFPKTPEDRVGMLFWRMHRCARIIFSLSFHLGKMTPEECVDFLVDRVGHERDNAAAEVRRSFNGSYGPLYQCAYMLGGLQIRALRHELVDSGKMTNRAFHDAVLHENSVPIEMIRASLSGQELTRGFTSHWRFYELKSKNPY